VFSQIVPVCCKPSEAPLADMTCHIHNAAECVPANPHVRRNSVYLCVQLVAGPSLQWVGQVSYDDVKLARVGLQLAACVIVDQLQPGRLKGGTIFLKVRMAEVAHHLRMQAGRSTCWYIRRTLCRCTNDVFLACPWQATQHAGTDSGNGRYNAQLEAMLSSIGCSA
jgi:hypothetical protein